MTAQSWLILGMIIGIPLGAFFFGKRIVVRKKIYKYRMTPEEMAKIMESSKELTREYVNSSEITQFELEYLERMRG